MTGQAGTVLFKYFYARYRPTEINIAGFQQELQTLVDECFPYQDISLCSGKAGINWLFSFLATEEVLEEQLLTHLCDDDSTLGIGALTLLERGNYDLLYGAIGIASYLMRKPGYESGVFFHNFFSLLCDRLRKIPAGTAIPSYDLHKGEIEPTVVNLGWAHGLPSIIKFCVESYQNDICSREAKSVGTVLSDFIANHVNSDTSYSFFPNMVKDTDQTTSGSRMAWCYGDLGIAYALYHSGTTFSRPEWTGLALQIFRQSATRRTFNQTRVVDAAICHGAAGIAHIFNRIWRLTRDPLFKETRDHWIKETLDFCIHEDTLSGFKKFNSSDQSLLPEIGFLEGDAGIGLVLLSYLTDDLEWDQCILLNG